MYVILIEFIAIVLVMAGSWHASRFEGRSFAQQWFVAGYLVALIRETLNQVVFQVYVFSPSAMRIGAAPAVITFLGAGIAYLAYAFSQRFVDSTKPGLVAGLVFLISASLALPIEATAAQLSWWVYTFPVRVAFGGVPIVSPIIWGGGAAIFYAVFWRVRQSRLPERGRFYALITLAPVIAVGQLLFNVLLNA